MDKQFRELRERLLQAGVAPRHVRRYLRELNEHGADLRAEEERAGHDRNHADARAMARLGAMDDLATAMISQRKFKAWTARAPWAAFSLGPLLLLAICYLAAGTILWTGWRIFLPSASMPFVGILDKRAILYFGVGRMLYFGAPILVGWAMALLAARQRLSGLWPIIAGILLAILGAAAQISASRAANARQQITMTFSLGSSRPETFDSVAHALVIAGFTLVPYFVWRLADLVSGGGNGAVRSES